MSLKRLIALTGILLAAGACSGDDPVEPTPTPSITLVAPNSGPALGGGTVTIAGSGFTGTPTVTFGGTAATGVTVSGGVSITATVPAGSPGPVTVTVVNADGKSGSLANGYTYIGAPSVTSVTPASGTIAGGNSVTITGSGFVAVPTVTFGGTAATNVAFVSSTSITAIVPAHAAGPVAVAVRNTDGQTGTMNNGYTYVAPPTITSATPGQGPAAGGTVVTIAGTGFVSGATVTFGGTAATAVTVGAGGTSLTATTPAHAAGTVTVVVTNPDGQGSTLTNGFTYNPSPTVTSVTPNSSTIAGGVSVVISGTGFAGVPTVTFGGTAGTNVVVASSTQLSVTVPAHTAGAVTVVVTNQDGQSGSLANAFTYRGPPTVASVAPVQGPAIGGTAVTVNGTGFVEGATVTFGGTPATGVSVGAGGTSISATTPPHTPGAATVVVTNPDGQSAQWADAFTYLAGPIVTNITPNFGSTTGGGPTVVIEGTGFLPNATVAFGASGATSVTVVSTTRLNVILPPSNPGVVDVLVTNADGQFFRLPNSFTYLTPPTITTVTPAEGGLAGGTQVVINGTDFVTGATVSFDGTAGTSAVVESPTQIRVTTPPRATIGPVTVTVTNPNGISGSKANGFTYVGTAILAKGHWLIDLAWDGGTFQFDADLLQQANPTIVVGASSFESGAITYTVITEGTITGSTINVNFIFREDIAPRGSVTCVATITGTGVQQRMTGTYTSSNLVPGAVGSTAGTCEIH